MHIIGANVDARCYAAASQIITFSGRTGAITAENCNFVILTTGAATIAESGTFINCDTWTSSTDAPATNFSPVTNSRPVIVYGGNHLAYTASQAQFSSVFYVAAGGANAVIMAYGVNCPNVARDLFFQTNSVRVNSGKTYISGITTQLAMSGSANYEINGHISINKT